MIDFESLILNDYKVVDPVVKILLLLLKSMSRRGPEKS